MRSIRPQTVTLAVLAILFGLGAVWAAKQVLLAKQVLVLPPVQAPPPEPTETILAVQTNLAADSRIREQDVGVVTVTEEKVKARNIPLDKVLRFKQQAVGRILKTEKLAAIWLTSDDFYPLGEAPALTIKKGYRAVTLRIDDPAVSSSIIRTGSLIDVILTAENPDDGTQITRRLVSAVEVISPPVSDGGLPNSVTSVSGKSYIVVQATPADADTLSAAQQKLGGTISVTLCAAPRKGERGSLDANNFDAMLSKGDFPVTERDLLGLPPRPVAAAAPERIVIEQIRGDKIDYVVFTDDNVRLSQEEARQESLPSGAGSETKPPKKCKNCGKPKKRGSELGPMPSPAPTPIPAPRDDRNQPESPLPAPALPKTT